MTAGRSAAASIAGRWGKTGAKGGEGGVAGKNERHSIRYLGGGGLSPARKGKRLGNLLKIRRPRKERNASLNVLPELEISVGANL